MRVILFDIDGTLIHTGGAGLAALRLAFAEVFAITDDWQISLSGRTDRGIARELFEMHGLEQSHENWLSFRDAYLRHLPTILPQRPGKVLPGVEALVRELSQTEDVAMGLLTGNVRHGANVKLQHFQLDHYFQFGGFGDHSEERDQVANEALLATRSHLPERAITADRMWVIGDTPLDIRCGRHIGAKVAAVATGSFTTAELEPFQPDLLLEDLAMPDVLRRLLA